MRNINLTGNYTHNLHANDMPLGHVAGPVDGLISEILESNYCARTVVKACVTAWDFCSSMVVTCLRPLPDLIHHSALQLLPGIMPDFMHGSQEIDIDHALSDANQFLRADAFSYLVKNTPEQLTQERINRALDDADVTVRTKAFRNLAHYTPQQLTQERIESALTDDYEYVRTNAFRNLAKYAPQHLTQEQINHALDDNDCYVRTNVFSCLARHIPEQLTQERINRALDDNDGFVRRSTFRTLAEHALQHLSQEQIESALDDYDSYVRANAFFCLARYSPEHLTEERIENALSDDDYHVRACAFSSLVEDTPEHLTEKRVRRSLFNNHVNQRFWFYWSSFQHSVIKCFVFPSGHFDQNAFLQLPFSRREYLRNGYLNELSRSELRQLDGRLFSALPDAILQRLDARVLNNLTDENKIRLGMRVFAKLSDKAFDDLDNSVFWPGNIVSALARDPLTFNPQAFADLPLKRQRKLAEIERLLEFSQIDGA